MWDYPLNLQLIQTLNVLNQKLWINLSTHNTKFISWKSGTMDLRLGELGLFSQLTIPSSNLGYQRYRNRTMNLRLWELMLLSYKNSNPVICSNWKTDPISWVVGQWSSNLWLLVCSLFLIIPLFKIKLKIS